MKVTVLINGLLLLQFFCDECISEYVDLYENLDEYTFYPEIGNCYEIYDQFEEVTSLTCQKPSNPERRSCINLIIVGKQFCLGLKTPTNETVRLVCAHSKEDLYESNTCFKISRPNRTDKEVCRQKFDNYSVGIITPDNFTILFYSAFCSASTSNKEIETYDNFINTFSYDSETERCYNIYNEYQRISPYTCLSDNVFISCANKLLHVTNCEGIITENNETVVLHCTEDKENSPDHSCFKIYTADNNLHIACPKRVEERCIGITTPSNLTVLLECYFCSESGAKFKPEVNHRKYGTYISTYLSSEYLGKNSYLGKSEFKTFNRNIPWKIDKYFLKKSTVYGYWLPNTTCYGVTLPSNETVILECTSIDEAQDLKHGCFVTSNPQMKEEQKQIVCIKILDGTCVGIITPMNWSLELACYSESDDFSDGPVNWQKNFDNYKFYPKIGNCYEIYDQDENVSPFICQRPANPGKYSCIHSITGEKHCLGLKTPSNETVQLLCENSKGRIPSHLYHSDLNTCFNISRPDKSYREVCQQKFDNHSIGITTPDKFTILFDSYFCSTSMSRYEGRIYNNYINTFLFDPEKKGCYKIYYEHQEVSPYTCLNENVFSSCVDKLPRFKNCEGIITQNNETIVLHCMNDTENLPDRSCFKIYTADNNLHIACQKRLEERCIGITTPSNLTVLLDCYFCIQPGVRNIFPYVQERRRYWSFVTTYLSNEILDKHSYLGQLKFKASQEKNANFLEYSKKISTVYGHWVPNSNCYGFTLDSNETVILKCISKERFGHIKPGCYPVINPKLKQEEIVCSKILDEACVGIITPTKWSVALACYFYNFKNTPEVVKETYIQKSAADSFIPSFTFNNCYEVYSTQEINANSCTNIANPENYSCVDWIPGKRGCLGLKTPVNETIELICRDSYDEDSLPVAFFTDKNCFNVYSTNNQTEQICRHKFGNLSIGVTTPSNYSILFHSFFCSTFKTPKDIQEYKEFINNFIFDPSVRSCYKVYTPDQDISPYTCSSNEVYDACIHPMKNTTMGIRTQNNEIVILENSDGRSAADETGCFKIYTSDNKVHSACQKQVEERCIGIVTPSNLTVLLECHTCISTKDGTELPIYTDQYRKTYRHLVEYFLYVFTQTNYALEDKEYLYAYTPEQEIKIIDCYNEIRRYDIHVLHAHNKCRGITSYLETIVLGCPNVKPEKPGCFDVFSPVFDEHNETIGPETKVGNVCVKIVNEWCVGITTPNNWTVTLSCFNPPSTVCGVVTVPGNGPPVAK